MLVRKEYNKKELVVNWHMLETCNYSCGFCFAKYGKDDSSIYYKSSLKTEELLNAIWQYFHENIVKKYSFSGIRLNFAGGEPTLLGDRLLDIISVAKNIGFRTSIITNASKLGNQEFSKSLYANLDILGISIDSLNNNTNKKIGRVDKKKQTLSLQNVSSYVDLARKINSNIEIKLNTVVNDANKNENFSRMIKTIQPNKWKVFKVMPQIADFLLITDKDFNNFLERHKPCQNIITSENNEEMRTSYIMIDPKGRFYQNADLKGHSYSQPLSKNNVAEEFQKMPFSIHKFQNRY